MIHSFVSLAFIFFPSVWAAPPSPTPAPLPIAFSLEAVHQAEKIFSEAVQAYEKINDYTATFLKQEQIREKLKKEEVIELKFQKPFRVYMNWIDSPDKGMEIIYKEGENKNRITGHLGGFLNAVTPTVNMEIRDKLATRNNRHLITETGIGEFLKKYEIDFQKAKERKEIQIVISRGHKLFDREMTRVEAFLPQKSGNGYYCYRSVVFFDVQNKLPIQMEFYDAADQLIEKYAYKNLKVNVGLKPIDFDPDNETYHF